MSAPRLIDTHCHLNFHAYDEDRDDVLRRAREAGVDSIIIPAIDLESCQQALALADRCAGLYVAVGIHPNSCSDFSPSALQELRVLSRHKRVVAIGEIGLDYYWDKCPPAKQQRALELQLELAADLQLPVILHNRESADDLMEILDAWAPSVAPEMKARLGVLHSFSASAEVALRALGLGFYLGFTGPITYKNADHLRAIAADLPVDRMLIESDGPFLAPQQRRGKRNEPGYVRYVNARLAELKGVTADDMARQTTLNAERLFALP
ncbi:MAG: TatD family hydrolase [Anaerolineae bacterium]|nr:TatD family hydrolase [Anaerolineae bacterium]